MCGSGSGSGYRGECPSLRLIFERVPEIFVSDRGLGLDRVKRVLIFSIFD